MFRDIVRQGLRIKGEILEIERRHGKNQTKDFTYWSGFDLGYLKGQLSILEDVMSEDEFQEFLEKEKLLINSFNKSKMRKLKRDKRNENQKRWSED